MYTSLCTAVYEYAFINLTMWVCRIDVPQTESVLMKYVLQRKKTTIILLTDVNQPLSLRMRSLALSGAWNRLINCHFHFVQNYYGTNKR